MTTKEILEEKEHLLKKTHELGYDIAMFSSTESVGNKKKFDELTDYCLKMRRIIIELK